MSEEHKGVSGTKQKPVFSSFILDCVDEEAERKSNKERVHGVHSKGLGVFNMEGRNSEEKCGEEAGERAEGFFSGEVDYWDSQESPEDAREPEADGFVKDGNPEMKKDEI
jgi:hypothetical protein